MSTQSRENTTQTSSTTQQTTPQSIIERLENRIDGFENYLLAARIGLDETFTPRHQLTSANLRMLPHISVPTTAEWSQSSAGEGPSQQMRSNPPYQHELQRYEPRSEEAPALQEDDAEDGRDENVEQQDATIAGILAVSSKSMEEQEVDEKGRRKDPKSQSLVHKYAVLSCAGNFDGDGGNCLCVIM